MSQRTYKKTKYPGVFTRPGTRGDTAYYVSLKNAEGKWERRLIGYHSQGLRPALAAEKRIEIQKQINGRLDPKVNDKVTFQDAYENYLSIKRARDSDVSRDINRWNLYLSRFQNVPLSDLTTRDFNEYLVEFRSRQKPVSEAYLEKIFGQARTMIRWAVKEDLWVGKNPLGQDSNFKMPTGRKSAKPSRWFTPQEAKRLLEECRKRSENLYRMSYLSLRTGMRITEIWGLGELEDAIDEVNGILNFIGKSKQREHVYTSHDVISMLKEYGRAPGELIFKNDRGERYYKTSKSFPRAVEAAGLASTTHKVWFHSWRHTFGSWLAQSGEFSLHEIMDYMRHTDQRMTLHYAKLIPGHKREGLDLIRKKLEGGMSARIHEFSRNAAVRP